MHPILFQIGPVTIYTYGVFVATAFLAVFYLLYKEAGRVNFYPGKILDLELIMLLCGIIGARLLHVLVNLAFYKESPMDIFLIWKGGLAFYGGLILSMIASWIYIKKIGLPLWRTADLIAPYLALGQSIGRIGCFLNGCCFGKPSGVLALGVMFPGDIVYRYPTQLYASFTLLCIFIILRFTQKKPPFSGFVFLFYIMLYSLQRFFMDFLRGDTPHYFLSLTVSQIISVLFFALAVIFMLCIRKAGNERI